MFWTRMEQEMFGNTKDSKRSGLDFAMQDEDHCSTMLPEVSRQEFRSVKMQLQGVLMDEQNIQNYLDWQYERGA